MSKCSISARRMRFKVIKMSNHQVVKEMHNDCNSAKKSVIMCIEDESLIEVKQLLCSKCQS